MNWVTTPDMLPSDYITGIAEDDIIQNESSFNTTVPFIHYTLDFPTREPAAQDLRQLFADRLYVGS